MTLKNTFYQIRYLNEDTIGKYSLGYWEIIGVPDKIKHSGDIEIVKEIELIDLNLKQ